MQVRLIVTYTTPKGTEACFTSHEMNIKHAIVIAEDFEKTGRLKHLTVLDAQDMTWTLKELNKYTKKIQTEVHDVTLYFDGGYHHHTKKSGLGCVIFYTQDSHTYRIRINALVAEIDSNNEAEYAALHLGLKELESLDVHHQSISVIGDSMVVMNQLEGEWPCYEPHLASWMDRIEQLEKRLGLTINYTLVPRKENQEADQLATQALAQIDVRSKKKLT